MGSSSIIVVLVMLLLKYGQDIEARPLALVLALLILVHGAEPVTRDRVLLPLVVVYRWRETEC